MLTLDDELFWLRAANLTAAENIGRWQAELELADGDTAKDLHELISSAKKPCTVTPPALSRWNSQRHL
jgi:hypothetical protein